MFRSIKDPYTIAINKNRTTQTMKNKSHVNICSET